MNDLQKAVCRALLRLSYEQGFGLFPVPLLREKVPNLPDGDLWDECEQKGELWPFHPAARGELAGLLTFSGQGEAGGIGVCLETKEMIEHWSDYRHMG